MCDFYYSQVHDEVALGWHKAYRLVSTSPTKTRLEGPYQPFYSVKADDEHGREFYWAEPVHSPDEKYRRGFHGFCVFASVDDANEYARYVRHRDGIFTQVIEVEVSGAIKRAEVYTSDYRSALRVSLAQKIRECLPNV